MDSMAGQEWIEAMEIDPSVWQINNRRWATPQHYTCSYMAMFPPSLPHYFISRFTKVGDTILDPFSGRGTTPLEAIAQNRIGIGNDLNDLAYVLTKGKLSNPSLEQVETRLVELEDGYRREDWIRFSGMPNKIRMIYHPETQKQLMFLRRELNWRDNDVDAFLTMVLMGAMHGQSSGFLSVSMPNTFSMGWNYVKRYIHEKSLKRPNRNAFHVIRNRCERFLRNGVLPNKGIAIHGDAKNLRKSGQIRDNSVKMIFTSPPYLKVIKYGLYNWIRLWWLLGEHKSVDKKLDDEHTLGPYLEFMREVFQSTLPLLNKKNGISFWVIGDVKNLNLARKVWDEIGSKLETKTAEGEIQKYRLLGIVSDEIREEEKVTKIWNSNQDKSGKATFTDRILIICPENSTPVGYSSNDEINWEPVKKP